MPAVDAGSPLLQTLRLLEGFDLRAMGHLSADTIHLLTEAMKLALADRDAYDGDPYNMRPLKSGGVFAPTQGGTTTCCVADRWGNVVAARPTATSVRRTASGVA